MKTDRFKKGGHYVSLDAVALYPNIIVQEGLSILKKKLTNDKKLHIRTDLSRHEILNLSSTLIEDPHFQCELGLFMQNKGVPMGQSLGRFFADLVLENLIETPTLGTNH